MRKCYLLIALLLIIAGSSSHAQMPVRDAVVGQAVDEQGNPIPDAEISVRYQSNPGGVSISRSTRTDRQGRYRIDLRQPLGVWTVHAEAVIAIEGREMTVGLIPDNNEPFAGNAGAVRNFRLRFVEQTADDPYGVGGMLVVASAIGDYTPLDGVTVTLHPVAGGASIQRKLRSTGEGWVVTGLRPQKYRVTVSQGGLPMLVSPALTPQSEYSWQNDYVGDFRRTGPGTYQIRVEVRSR